MITLLNWLIAALVSAAALAVAALAVGAVLDNRRVRRTDELMERLRAGETPPGEDEVGDDVVRMLAAWRDETRP